MSLQKQTSAPADALIMQALFSLLLQALAARFKSRTYLFAIALGLFGLAQQVLPVFQGNMTPETFGLIMSSIAAVIAALREATSTPLAAYRSATTEDERCRSSDQP